MGLKVNFTLKNNGTQYFIELMGEIDEDSDFQNLKMPNASQITVDFNGVTRIQSFGIRSWIQAIAPYKNISFIYKNCPKIIIDQINMLEGFLPKNGKVESFYVPYYSEKLNIEKNILFRYGIEFDDNGILALQSIKDEKGVVFEMDAIENKYFKFLKY